MAEHRNNNNNQAKTIYKLFVNNEFVVQTDFDTVAIMMMRN